MLRTVAAGVLVFAATLIPFSAVPASSHAVHSKGPDLAGDWLVTTTCHPRCYANPKLTDNYSTRLVHLTEKTSDGTLYFYAGYYNKFSKSPGVLIPLSKATVALHSHI